MTKENRNLIYCHGLPGSAEELNFLSRNDSKRIHVFGPQHQVEIDVFANSDVAQRLHVIGFSLGAMAAIKISLKYANVVGKMSLISPAAPLELGDFLPAMAGRSVFQSALRSVLQFRVLTALQKIGVSLSSELAISTMFKGSPESEIVLLKDPKFNKALAIGLKESYGKTTLRIGEQFMNTYNHGLMNLQRLNAQSGFTMGWRIAGHRSKWPMPYTPKLHPMWKLLNIQD